MKTQRPSIAVFEVLIALLAVSTRAQTPATAPATRPALPEATSITLAMKQVHPMEVYQEVARQADAVLRTYPRDLWESRPWEKIDVEVKALPLWQALDAVGEKTGLSLQRAGPDRELVVAQINAAGATPLPGFHFGPFYAVVGTINRAHNIDLSTGEVKRNCILRLNLNAEPKVRILRGPTITKILEAVDENGTPIPAVDQGPAERHPQTLSWSWNLAANLAPPGNAGKRLARLRGSWQVLVQTRSQVIEIPDILAAANVVKEVEGRQLRVREVRRNSTETYTISATVSRTLEAAADPAPWDEISFLTTFRVFDADGNPLTRRNYGSSTAGPGNTLELNLIFARDEFNGPTGEPARLVWEVPLGMAEVTVPFEFKDLPLP